MGKKQEAVKESKLRPSPGLCSQMWHLVMGPDHLTTCEIWPCSKAKEGLKCK